MDSHRTETLGAWPPGSAARPALGIARMETVGEPNPMNKKALAKLCKQFTESPHTTPLMDILDDAEERAHRMGREPHRLWRMRYEACRGFGYGIQESVVRADNQLAEFVARARKKLGAGVRRKM